MTRDRAGFSYRFWGLRVWSEIELPTAPSTDTEFDVTIRRGEVPPAITNPRDGGPYFQVSPEAFLWRPPGTARTLVREGREITIDSSAALAGVPTLFQQVFGALLHQRGLLPLHASAGRVDGRAVLFCGASGEGKSTLAGQFAAKGAALSDDVCAIDVSGTPRISPGPRFLKLHTDAVASIGRTTNEMPETDEDRFILPLAANDAALEIDRIYVLRTSQTGEICERAVSPTRAALILLNQTFWRRYARGMGRGAEHFKACTELSMRIPIYNLERPRDLSLMPKVVALIERRPEPGVAQA